MGTITHMATKAQGNASGLALRFVEYIREELARRNMTIEALAKATGTSTNYLATRLRGERILNLKDFESIAVAFELDPQEMLARIEFEPARSYRGRLVPIYGATISQKQGIEIYRTDDAIPPVREMRMRLSDVEIDATLDNMVIPDGVHVSGSGEDVETRKQDEHTLAAKKRSNNRGEVNYD